MDLGGVEWLVWRPIIAKVVTLQELETYYSLTDLMDVHDAIDIDLEIQKKLSEKT